MIVVIPEENPLKLLKFQISFDTSRRRDSLGVFFPGEVIHGRLKLEYDKELKCRGIAVTFRGQAELLWNEQSLIDASLLKPLEPCDITKTTYFERTVHLLGLGGSLETLKSGVHSFPFEFRLPSGIPSSFNGTHGKVWYEAEATIFSEKSQHAMSKAKANFEVDGVLDLNAEPGLCDPVELRKTTTPLTLSSCCVCTKTCRNHKRQIDFVLDISKRGFVPGEFLMGSVQLSNRSSTKVQKSMISLVQKITYVSEKRKKVEKQTICTSQGPEVESGGFENWQIALKIPEDLALSRLALGAFYHRQQIIDVEYALTATVHWGLGMFEMKGKIPLILGTVPLQCIDDPFRPYSSDVLIIENY